MSKITLSNVADLTQTTTAQNTINVNSSTVQAAFDNTLSRSGTAPNQMAATLDMNNNQIINLPSPTTVNSPVRLTDLNTAIGGGTITINQIPTGGTQGQVLTKNSSTNFDTSWNTPFGIFNVRNFGATGNGVTNDTSAFQAAITAASGNQGKVVVPAGNYVLGAINSANLGGYIVEGMGPSSKLIVSGTDSAGNWWDLCGASNVIFRNLLIVNNGSIIPKVLFPWMATLTSGALMGLEFDHVDISAATSLAMLYGYYFGFAGGSGAATGGGSLRINNCTWFQINNGPAFTGNTNTPQFRNSCVQLNAINSANVSSANTTVNTIVALCAGALFTNFYVIDSPTGFAGTSSIDNNAGVIIVNGTNFQWTGGGFQTHCDASLIIWSNNQGLAFDQVQFQADDGGSAHTNRWVWMGGGLNTFITFIAPFWSSPGQAFIDFAPGIGGVGGCWYLTILGNNVAGSTSPPFLGNVYGPGVFTATANWFINLYIQMYGATTINSPGSVDSHSIFQGPTVLNLTQAGATDSSHKF